MEPTGIGRHAGEWKVCYRAHETRFRPAISLGFSETLFAAEAFTPIFLMHLQESKYGILRSLKCRISVTKRSLLRCILTNAIPGFGFSVAAAVSIRRRPFSCSARPDRAESARGTKPVDFCGRQPGHWRSRKRSLVADRSIRRRQRLRARSRRRTVQVSSRVGSDREAVRRVASGGLRERAFKRHRDNQQAIANV
jgi:hypothetical protein